MTSSAKLEVNNIAALPEKATLTCKKLPKFDRVVFEICERTDKQTILRTPPGDKEITIIL